jgi:hypothetical protein
VLPHAKAGWEKLHQTIELDDEACLRVVPRSVRQERPQQAQGLLSTAATIEGELALEHPCSDPDPSPVSELPPLEVSDEVPDGIRLRAPLRLAWADVLAALNASLDGKLPTKRLALQSALIENSARVVLEVEHDSEVCGPVWLTAEPYFDAESGAVRLRKVGLYPDWKPHRKLDDLPAQLERHARIPLPIALEDLHQRLERALATYVPPIDEVDVEIALERPTIAQVALDPNGFIPVVSVTGHAAVRGE